MKPSRLILSFLAFAFAILSAFAFKPLNGTLISYIGISTGEPVCVATSLICPGVGQDCTLYVPNVGTRAMFEYAPTPTCGVRLQMSL